MDDTFQKATQEIIDVLEAARDLITPVGSWTQFENARDVDGDAVFATDTDAVCWCMNGALIATTKQINPLLRTARHSLEVMIECDALTTYNDTGGRTQQEIIDAFNKTIGYLKAEG